MIAAGVGARKAPRKLARNVARAIIATSTMSTAASTSAPAAHAKGGVKRQAARSSSRASKRSKSTRAADAAVKREPPAAGGAPMVQPQTSNPAFPTDGLVRCEWCLGSSKPEIMREYVRYHDEEWGRPVRDERTLFEFFTLEGAQAGLSWSTIMMKREGYTRAFDNWDVERIARYDSSKVEELLADPGIVRNRLKVASTINNAKLVLKMRDEPVSFSDFLWSFVGGKPVVTRHASLRDLPLVAPEAEEMSKALKKRGFRFCGPTMCTSLMQACGMVNHHVTGCFRHPDRLM